MSRAEYVPDEIPGTANEDPVAKNHIKPEWTACETDADYELVYEPDCCPSYCNTAAGIINRKYLDEFNAQFTDLSDDLECYDKDSGLRHQCPLWICPPPLAVCIDNHCARKIHMQTLILEQEYDYYLSGGIYFNHKVNHSRAYVSNDKTGTRPV